MPKIYYCEHCHKFEDREGFLFEVIRTKPSIYCPECKNKCKIFEVDYTNWVKIGTPVGIIFGIIFFIWSTLKLYNSNMSTIETIILIIVMLLISIIVIIGIAGSLSIFDPEAAAQKILKEHPELVEKKLKAQYKKLPNHCNKCNKELPVGTNKCPYCGQEQY